MRTLIFANAKPKLRSRKKHSLPISNDREENFEYSFAQEENRIIKSSNFAEGLWQITRLLRSGIIGAEIHFGSKGKVKNRWIQITKNWDSRWKEPFPNLLCSTDWWQREPHLLKGTDEKTVASEVYSFPTREKTTRRNCLATDWSWQLEKISPLLQKYRRIGQENESEIYRGLLLNLW